MNQKIDRRTYDRYMEKGQLKKTDVDAFLKALPDETNNATWVQMDLEETEGPSRSNGSGEGHHSPEGT